MISRVPRVATSAVRPPFRSRMSLVATVVPKRKRSMAAGAMPCRSRRWTRPFCTARAGSAGTDGTFSVCMHVARYGIQGHAVRKGPPGVHANGVHALSGSVAVPTPNVRVSSRRMPPGDPVRGERGVRDRASVSLPQPLFGNPHSPAVTDHHSHHVAVGAAQKR